MWMVIYWIVKIWTVLKSQKFNIFIDNLLRFDSRSTFIKSSWKIVVHDAIRFVKSLGIFNKSLLVIFLLLSLKTEIHFLFLKYFFSRMLCFQVVVNVRVRMHSESWLKYQTLFVVIVIIIISLWSVWFRFFATNKAKSLGESLWRDFAKYFRKSFYVFTWNVSSLKKAYNHLKLQDALKFQTLKYSSFTKLFNFQRFSNISIRLNLSKGNSFKFSKFP